VNDLTLQIILALLTPFNINHNKKAHKNVNCTPKKDTVKIKSNKYKCHSKACKYNSHGSKGNEKFKTLVVGFNCNSDNILVTKYNEGYFNFIYLIDIDLEARTLTLEGTSSGEINPCKLCIARENINQNTYNKSSGDSTDALNRTVQSGCSSTTVNLIESTIQNSEAKDFTNFSKDS
jgi:hypothetical protein